MPHVSDDSEPQGTFTADQRNDQIKRDNDGLQACLVFALIVLIFFVWCVVADEEYEFTLLLWGILSGFTAGATWVMFTRYPTNAKPIRPSFFLHWLVWLIVLAFLAFMLNDRLGSRVERALDAVQRDIERHQILGP